MIVDITLYVHKLPQHIEKSFCDSQSHNTFPPKTFSFIHCVDFLIDALTHQTLFVIQNKQLLINSVFTNLQITPALAEKIGISSSKNSLWQQCLNASTQCINVSKEVDM